MSPNGKCETCTEPTKYVCGLWDGRDPDTGKRTHGVIFDCKSRDCEFKIRERESIKDFARLLAKVAAENEENGIDPGDIAEKRRARHITIRKMADHLGITPSRYSDYEKGRAAILKSDYAKILDVFRGVQL